MFVFSLLAFLICPLISLPFIFIGFKKDYKHRMVYLTIAAVFVALFSYSYRPTVREDLYRHHIDTMQYQNENLDKLGEELSSNPEQLSIIYKFLISKTGNQDLLQFFTSVLSYFTLFYLLEYYSRSNENAPRWRKIGVWLFTLSGFHFIVITSGIFYTLALELFALGVHFDYCRRKKVIGALLYIVPVFIHTCAILPLILMLLYKILGSKTNIKNCLIVMIIILSIGILLSTIAPAINLPIMNEISNLYKAYFNNEEQWSGLHTLPVLLLYLSRLVPVVFSYILVKTKDRVSDFAMFITVAILTLYLQTTFSIRYIHIAVLCGLPMFFNSTRDKRYGQIFSLSLYFLAIPHIIYQIIQLMGLGSFDRIERLFVTNLITMLSRG